MLPERPVHISGLTETATADTAAHQFHHCPVLGHPDKGHQRCIDILHGVHVLHHLARHDRRDVLVFRRKGTERPVRSIGDFVERRNIDPGDRGSSTKKLLSAPLLVFETDIQIQEVIVDHLPFANIEQIEKGSDGLRVVGAGTASDHQRVLFCPFLRVQRDPGELQHLQDIGIAHLILQCDAEEIAFPHRPLALQRKQRDLLFPHHPVQVGPGREYPLTVHILPAVEHTVEDLQTQVAHADLVHIRKTHRETHRDAVRILFHTVDLPADISGGLLDAQQQFIIQRKLLHSHFRSLSLIGSPAPASHPPT